MTIKEQKTHLILHEHDDDEDDDDDDDEEEEYNQQDAPVISNYLFL